MTWSLLSWGAGPLWLAGALVLAIAELIAPGFFLIFVAAGAAVTGFILLAMPDLHAIAQATLFAVFSGIAVVLGRGWYLRLRQVTVETGLNDRTGKMVGKMVEVSEAIIAGKGRVRVGDGAWNAHGPDAPAGAMVRIVGAEGSVLMVELA